MDVLEELTEHEPDIDRPYVERRVKDWQQRVGDLYAKVRGWLPQGWTFAESRSVGMHEPLMRRFDVERRDFPILTLAQSGRTEAMLEPRGLWIIGANGRVDFVRRADRYVIVDSAEILATPRRRVPPFFARRERTDLTQGWLTRVLA